MTKSYNTAIVLKRTFRRKPYPGRNPAVLRSFHSYAPGGAGRDAMAWIRKKAEAEQSRGAEIDWRGVPEEGFIVRRNGKTLREYWILHGRWICG